MSSILTTGNQTYPTAIFTSNQLKSLRPLGEGSKVSRHLAQSITMKHKILSLLYLREMTVWHHQKNEEIVILCLCSFAFLTIAEGIIFSTSCCSATALRAAQRWRHR
jgi:hypothetical protein